MQSPQSISAYIIDEIQTPHSEALKFAKKFNNHPLFALVIASKIHPHKQGWIQVLGKHPLTTARQTHKSISLLEKLEHSFKLLTAVGIIHQNSCTLGPQKIEDIVRYSSNQDMKLLAHRMHILNVEEQKNREEVKMKKNIDNALKYGIQSFYSQTKERYSYIKVDLWKWAYYTASKLLFENEVLESSLEKILSKQSIKEQEQLQIIPESSPNVKELLKITQKDILIEFLKQLKSCMHPWPKNRPSIESIASALASVIKDISEKMQQVNQYHLQSFKLAQNSHVVRPEFAIQIPADQSLILTAEMKKKLSIHMTKICHKTIKDYKALYRATRFEFSPQIFYAQCSGNKNILFCIDTVDHGVIFVHIAPEITLIEDNGIKGDFIADPSLQSFIFSTKNNQVYQLVVKEKAYLSSPMSGPIIGNGDIILGNNPNSNWCYFPNSYEPSKKKHLIDSNSQKNPFRIKNYDVYKLIFKK